jgi:catalase
MFKNVIISSAFALIQKYLIDKITFEPLRSFFQAQITPAIAVADLLTDSNPNNNEQLRAFWDRYQSELQTNSISFAIGIVREKVKDEDIKKNIIDLLSSLDAEGKPKV